MTHYWALSALTFCPKKAVLNFPMTEKETFFVTFFKYNINILLQHYHLILNPSFVEAPFVKTQFLELYHVGECSLGAGQQTFAGPTWCTRSVRLQHESENNFKYVLSLPGQQAAGRRPALVKVQSHPNRRGRTQRHIKCPQEHYVDTHSSSPTDHMLTLCCLRTVHCGRPHFTCEHRMHGLTTLNVMRIKLRHSKSMQC